jgi:hypothetical protein
MALSGLSLNAATTVGPGAAIMFDEPRLVVAQVTLTGPGVPPNSWNLELEGTLDGINWGIFRNFSASNPGTYLLSNTSDPPVLGVRASMNLAPASGDVSVFFSASKF